MSDAELLGIARRWFDAVNTGDVKTLDQIVAYDVLDHSGLSDSHGYRLEGHKKLSLQLRKAFPGWQSHIDRVAVHGDLVIIDHSGRGVSPSGVEQLLGFARSKDPSARHMELHMRSCVRIENGKIVEHWALKGPFGKKSAPDYLPEVYAADSGAAASNLPTAWSNGPAGTASDQGTDAYQSPNRGWGAQPSPEENKRFLQRYVKNVIDGENPQLAEGYFTPNFYNHDPAPGEQTGLRGVKQFLKSIFAAFTGFNTTIEEQIAEGDLVVGRWSQRFTNTGPYLNFSASGRPIHIGGITITRVRNGKLVEQWEARDAVSLLIQMKVVKPLGPLESAISGDQKLVNEAVAGRFFYEAWNAGNAALVDEIVASDFVNHNLLEGQADGPAGLKQWIEGWRSAFPDMSVTIDLVISEGPKVATRWTLNGTHRNTFLGIPATGKFVALPGITIFRVEGGKIKEAWGFWEQAGMLGQLGVRKVRPISGRSSKRDGSTSASNVDRIWHRSLKSMASDLQSTYGTEPLVRSIVAQVPPAPALFALAKFTYAPGSTFGPAAGLGPVAFRMQAGKLTFSAQGPLVLTKSSTDAVSEPQPVSPGTAFDILPGDQLLVPGNTPHTARNSGSETAAMIGLAVFQQVPPQQFPPGVEFHPLIMGTASLLPAAPITVLVDRIDLRPGRSIDRRYPGPALYHIAEGALNATVGAGEVFVVRAGRAGPFNQPQRAAIGEALPLSSGDGLFAQADAAITLRSTSSPTVLIRGVALTENVGGKKDIASRYFNEVWNAGDLSLLDEMVSARFVNHNPLTGQLPGRSGLKQLVQRWRTAFPDSKVSVELRVAEGEKVATRWNASGTHMGRFLGVAPTGKTVDLSGITIFRISAATIHESWEYWNGARLLQQLGIIH